MKTHTKLQLTLFAACLWVLMPACHFTPQVKPTIEDILNADTTLLKHSEIQVQELSESEMWYRTDEPRYLNED